MAEISEATIAQKDHETDVAERRVYEVGYLILPTVKEDELETVISDVRTSIEKAGGSFIAEGAPVSIKLAYTMYVSLGGKQQPYDRAYFGWLKFEVAGSVAHALDGELRANPNVLRSIIFKTVREDTRAVARHAVLREVKRTDTIKSTPSKGAEQSVAGEVSEAALDKSIEELIA